MEDTRITENGNDLYFTFENGTQTHLYKKGDILYSDDDKQFTQIN